jgi:protein-L-isoaspartate(D-aspartate) O-methyltransferase
LYIDQLKKALEEITRVSKDDSYIVVESYRNEKEKANLLCWQLTCECFFTPQEWEWLFKKFKYTGDYSFVFFE